MSPLSPRLRRRLVRHHLPIGVACAAASALAVPFMPSNQAVARWSLATAYVGLALIAASLALGPLNLLRGRPNPTSTDLRRDVGIWAGILSVVHFVVGWQVHMKHRWQYWLRERPSFPQFVPRLDLFGVANHTGLVALLVAALLLALSNDRTLRQLGRERWKALQRWNYALIALVALHGAAYQVAEKRVVAFVALFALMLGGVLVVQGAGMRRYRAWRSDRADRPTAV